MGSNPEGRSGLVFWLLLTVALTTTSILRWPEPGWLSTDFKSLLPGGQFTPWQDRAAEAASSNFDQQLVLLVQGNDPARASQFMERARGRFHQGGYVDADFEQEQADRWSQLSDALYPYRWGLLKGQATPALSETPSAYFADFQRLLYSPLGIARLRSLERDPTGHFSDFMQSLAPTGFISRGNSEQAAQFATLSLNSERLGFSRLPELHAIYQDLEQAAAEQGLVLSMSGVPLYSAFGVVSAQSEMRTIGLASLLVLVVLLAWFLRSLSALVLTLTCVAAGIAGGFAVTVLLLGQLHILTLVFGVTLIGIAADYALHYLAHSRLPGWTPSAALGKVFRGLLLGMASSVLAFAALVFLPFPGIRQIGLFMASGLFCSFLTVCLLFPAVFRRRSIGHPPGGLFALSPKAIRLSAWLVVPLVLLSVAALSLLPGRDDIRAFYSSPAQLDAAQERIAVFTGHQPDSRYLLIRGDNASQLLTRDSEAAALLGRLVEQGGLAGFSAVSRVLPPEAVQRDAIALWQGVADSGHIDSHMRSLGFSAEFVVATRDAVTAAPAPAGLALLQELALPLGIGGFLGCDQTGCASWIRLWGVADAARLEQVAMSVEGLALVDPIASINADISSYRKAVAWMLLLAAGMALVLLGLAVGPRAALTIILVPVLASVLTLAVLGLARGGYSLVNLMGLLLVFGVGLDYGVFRSVTRDVEQAATSLAIALSAATSVLAFGMLSFSSTPVIATFGETIALGLLFAYGLSWLHWRPSRWE
jgi:predicted exporter